MITINDIAGLKVHSVANVMPMMSEEELLSLQLDIKENGLHEPIWLCNLKGEDYIIDGRNRAIACQRIGVVPEIRYYEGDEDGLLEFVLSLNLHRRHLNTGQKACLAVNVLPDVEAQVKRNLSKKISAIRTGQDAGKSKRSSEIVAEIFGVSASNVKNAKRLKSEDSELFDMVLSGTLPISKAMINLKSKNSAVNTEDEVKLPQAGIENANIILEDEVKLPQAKSNMTKADQKKVSELVELGLSEDKALNYIMSKKKPKIIKPKTSFSNRIEFKVDESEKELLMNIAKQKGMSLSEMLREVVKNIK